VKRFPIGLTVAAAIAFAALVGLGVWQIQRLAWKRDVLARIDALQHAPARPLDRIAAKIARGEDVGFTRVDVACAPPPGVSPPVFRYAIDQGQMAWRLLGACRAALGPYDGVVVDRGVITEMTGAMAPTPAAFAPPAFVTGILRAPNAKSRLDADTAGPAGGPVTVRVFDAGALKRAAAASGLAHPLPYVLAVESEAPPAPGLAPAALPRDIPNNHLIYALTWFSFAAMVAGFYGVLVRRRTRTT